MVGEMRCTLHSAICNLHCVHLQITWCVPVCTCSLCTLNCAHSKDRMCTCTLCTCRYLVYTVRRTWCTIHSALCIMQLNVTFTLKTHKRFEKLTLTRIIRFQPKYQIHPTSTFWETDQNNMIFGQSPSLNDLLDCTVYAAAANSRYVSTAKVT